MKWTTMKACKLLYLRIIPRFDWINLILTSTKLLLLKAFVLVKPSGSFPVANFIIIKLINCNTVLFIFWYYFFAQLQLKLDEFETKHLALIKILK